MIKTGFTDATIKLNQFVHTHSIPDRQLHTARRKLLNHAFSDSAMRSLEPQVLQRIREWCGFLSQPKPSDIGKISAEKTQQWSMKRNMAEWSSFLTTDVLSQVCFSQDIGSCKNGGSDWDVCIPQTLNLLSKVSVHDGLMNFAI